MANTVFAKGSASITMNPQETEARLKFVPDPDGYAWDTAAVNKLAMEKNLPAFHDQKALETFLVKAGKAKNTESLEMVFAEGIRPEEPVGEKVVWADLEVPEDMILLQQETLSRAGPPQVYRIRVEKIRHEKKVKKTGALSFMHGKEEVEVSWERRETREKAEVDERVLEVKYAGKEKRLGTVTPSIPGKPGKNVFGRQIPPHAPVDDSFLLGRGISRLKNELVAMGSGFVRIGENWADLVSMSRHSYSINTGIDGITLFFNFDPGDEQFAPPSGEEILKEAMIKGAAEASLVSAKELDREIAHSIESREPIYAFALSSVQEAEARVDINQDKTSAVLYLRKGIGGGRPLEMKAISQALKESGLHGYDAEQLRADIQTFIEGKETVLSDYVLAEGVSSTRGRDREVLVSAAMLHDDEKLHIIQRLERWYKYDSNDVNFDLSGAIEVAFVDMGEVVASVSPESEGEDGKDIYGKVLPGLPGNDPDIKLFNGLELQGNEILASEKGLLIFSASDYSFHGEVVSYKDAEIAIHTSSDGMEARGDFIKEEGPGIPLSVENIKKVMAYMGIKKGINLMGLEKACAYAREKGSLKGHVIAKGVLPIARGGSAVTWLIQMNLPELSGADVSGETDTSGEEYISRKTTVQVKAGVPIVEFSEQQAAGRPGYDVRGNEIPIEKGTFLSIEHDESIRELPYGKGMRLIAARSGELRFNGKKLEISSIKTIQGDVSPATGNLKFSGEIQIGGDVLPGCVVMGGSHVTVNGLAVEALVSAGGKATIAMGFKGCGKGILKARAGIAADFVERASVMAVGDIHLNKGSILSKIRTNGKLFVASETGKMAGGFCQARQGVDAANIGSDKGIRTEISFGQDYLIKDEIVACEENIIKIKNALSKTEEKISDVLGSKLPLPDDLRTEKIRLVKLLEQENLKVFNLREKFEEHHESEVRSRGTVFPGVVIESHNRYYEVKQMRSKVVFYFDRESGRIKEKPLE